MAKEENLFEEKAKEEGGKPAANTDKLKALRAAMDKIEKNYGKGSIMKLGDENIEDIEVIPTGSIALNAALGVGGYPKGRIVEIYGPESSGKTTIAIHAIAEAQKKGGIAAFIDAERACRPILLSPISPSISALGVKAATESITMISTADERINCSAISKACSPLSGWEIHRFSTSTPNFSA